jgi:hypothetical protein
MVERSPHDGELGGGDMKEVWNVGTEKSDHYQTEEFPQTKTRWMRGLMKCLRPPHPPSPRPQSRGPAGERR